MHSFNVSNPHKKSGNDIFSLQCILVDICISIAKPARQFDHAMQI